ncbi:type VII secretion-associated serine protease mycosin [Actinomadura nitritigenes]
MATAISLPFLLLDCPLAQAAPRPRAEEWWFEAWQITQKVWPLTEGEGITIGLIDTGVEARLPELRGVVLPGKDFAGPSDHEGRVDTDSELGGHGTGMAALISGQGSGSGMVGIAPKSRILPISKVSGDYEKPIRYAVDHGAKVINMSEGVPTGSCPSSVQAAVDYAIQHDVVIVAAAGNDAHLDSTDTPANCSGVLAVGGIDAHLSPWQDSTPGPNVMIAAPSVSVGSIGKAGVFSPGGNGTSSATALTSGVVALLRSHFPRMSGREIVQRMLATARDVGPKGRDEKTGYGALIPYKALTAHVPADFPNPVYSKSRSTTSQKNAGKTEILHRRESPSHAVRSSPHDESTTWAIVLIATTIALLTITGLTYAAFRHRRST